MSNLDQYLQRLEKALVPVQPPEGILDRVHSLIQEAPLVSDLPELPVVDLPAPRLADEIRRRIQKTEGVWRLQKYMGTSAAVAATLFLAVSWMGWGYVRDSFQSVADLGNQSVRIERSLSTGISGAPSTLLGILEDDPFMNG
ncbi:hypothetical protein H8D30_06280 [bacterium]|nr:hypothetical protein [bacterium]